MTGAANIAIEERTTTQRVAPWVMLACAVTIAIPLVRALLHAQIFPVVHDSATMRFVVFMIERGHAPYTWMVEMNPPGTLMTEWLSMHVFGPTAIGLWRWDLFVGLVAVSSAVWLAGPRYRAAGACGAMLLWLAQVNYAPLFTGERDWYMGSLLLLSAAFAVHSQRSGSPAWIAGALFFGAWAASIKPFAALTPLVFFALHFAWAPDARYRRKLLLYALAGGAVPVIATLLYLLHWPGAMQAFIYIERTIGPWYLTVGNASLSQMLAVFLRPVLALCILAFVLWLCERPLPRPTVLLIAGGCCALSMHFVQRKAYPFHAYPGELFLLVGGCIAAQRALTLRLPVRVLGTAFLLLAAVWMPVRFWQDMQTSTFAFAAQDALIDELKKLGGSELSGKVQCLDVVTGGCVGALYQLGIQQPTGVVNDGSLFPSVVTPVPTAVRERFLTQFRAAPPQLVILSNDNWPNNTDFTFSKLDRWPEFAAIMRNEYRLQTTVKSGIPGDQIYVRTQR